MSSKGPWKPTGKEKLYKITKPFAKYARIEDRDGKEYKAMYSGLDPRNPNWPSEVLLDERKFQALRIPLKLVPVGERPRVVIQSPAESDEEIVVPSDWAGMKADDKKALASKILGDDVSRVREAERIIEDFISKGA